MSLNPARQDFEKTVDVVRKRSTIAAKRSDACTAIESKKLKRGGLSMSRGCESNEQDCQQRMKAWHVKLF
ncbi:MAG: hypothetical protein CMR00_08425 [[Chlorobium] sp. 445]|nr:MAG: hypothetical protein CMR00_08425 [[Chlorobium] sp. 445]